jgi:GTP-binding protein
MSRLLLSEKAKAPVSYQDLQTCYSIANNELCIARIGFGVLMSFLQHAAFLTTVARLGDLPQDARAEVAFAGRSNAGKSSAINTLAGRTRLAYVSKTPGRTQHLNYFTLQPGKYLVDLPGYGFAKAPGHIRAQWEGLLAPYLSARAPLVGLVMIMDCRRPLTELDVRMMDWFLPTGRPVHILLTKADKLSRQAQASTLKKVEQALAAWGEQCSAQLFSSLKKEGVDRCEAVLGRWLDIPLSAPQNIASS